MYVRGYLQGSGNGRVVTIAKRGRLETRKGDGYGRIILPVQQVSYGPLIMSIMLIMSCNTGFFNVRSVAFKFLNVLVLNIAEKLLAGR
jgi:hypothetical protein